MDIVMVSGQMVFYFSIIKSFDDISQYLFVWNICFLLDQETKKIQETKKYKKQK